MIMKHDAQLISGIFNAFGHFHIIPAGCGITAGVVMYQNNGGGMKLKRSLNDFPWIDRGMVNRAFLLFLIGNQTIFPVQKQDTELLILLMAELDLAIINKGLPVGQDRLIHDFTQGQLLGGGLNQFQIGNNGISDAGNFT